MFAKSDNDVGTTGIVFFEIDMADIRNFRRLARSSPYNKQFEALKQKLENLLMAKIMHQSTSPWASRIVMVFEKDNGWRICVVKLLDKFRHKVQSLSSTPAPRNG